MSDLSKSRFLRVLVSESYERDGETRKNWLQVGSAWFRTSKGNDEYISLRIFPGLSVSGELVIMPARDADEPTTKTEQPQHKRTGDDGGEKKAAWRKPK